MNDIAGVAEPMACEKHQAHHLANPIERYIAA